MAHDKLNSTLLRMAVMSHRAEIVRRRSSTNNSRKALRFPGARVNLVGRGADWNNLLLVEKSAMRLEC